MIKVRKAKNVIFGKGVYCKVLKLVKVWLVCNMPNTKNKQLSAALMTAERVCCHRCA